MPNLKCYTLSYDPMGDGFDTGLMDKQLAGRAVAVEHAELFCYDGLPRLTLVLRVVPCAARAAGVTDYRDRLREADRPLYDALMRWRRRASLHRVVPEHRVVSTRALAGIAATRPGTGAHLLDVVGVGRKTASRYGDEILGVVRAAS